jgi:ATP-dependent protease ClpP protease subunit
LKKHYLILANAARDKNLVGIVVCEAKGTVATFKIRGYIGSEKNNPDVLSLLVDDAIAKGCKTAVVQISTQGGSVYDAADMVAELERFGEGNVTVYAGALVASAGTRFLTKFKSVGRPNSQFMIHKPSAGSYGTETDMENGLVRLKNTTNDYRAAYAKKMQITEAQVEALWANGDKWFTAKQALDAKLIDVIEGTAEVIDTETTAMLRACGAPVIPVPKKQSSKIMDRDELIALLGLDASASDEQIKAAVAAKKPATQNTEMNKTELIASLGLDANATEDQIKDAISKMKTSASAHDAAQKEAENHAKTNAENAVKAAITAKKVPATQLESLVKMYMATPKETQAMLDALPEGKALSAELDTDNPADLEASRKDWKLSDYLDKDPKALAAMEKGDPKRFKQLNDDYYGA